MSRFPYMCTRSYSEQLFCCQLLPQQHIGACAHLLGEKVPNQSLTKCSNCYGTVYKVKTSKLENIVKANNSLRLSAGGTICIFHASCRINLVFNNTIYSFCCRSEWAWSEGTRHLSDREKNTFFFETQGIVVKGAMNCGYARKEELTWGVWSSISLL